MEQEFAELLVVQVEDAGLLVEPHPRAQLAFGGIAPPGPDVAEPDRREDMDRRRLLPVIGDLDPPQQIIRRAFGDLLQHIEVGVVVEEPEVGQLDLAECLVAPEVLLDQIVVWVFALRVFVEPLGV